MSNGNQRVPPFEQLKKRLEESINRALVNQTQDVLQIVSDRMATALAVYTEQFVAPAIARIGEAEQRIDGLVTTFELLSENQFQTDVLIRLLTDRVEWIEKPWYERAWITVRLWVGEVRIWWRERWQTLVVDDGGYMDLQ